MLDQRARLRDSLVAQSEAARSTELFFQDPCHPQDTRQDRNDPGTQAIEDPTIDMAAANLGIILVAPIAACDQPLRLVQTLPRPNLWRPCPLLEFHLRHRPRRAPNATPPARTFVHLDVASRISNLLQDLPCAFQPNGC